MKTQSVNAQSVKTQSKGLNISAKSFIVSLVVIFLLTALTYFLTFVIPAGEYARIPDASGNLIIDTEKGYTPTSVDFPFWKWLLSPFLVLGADGSAAVIAVIVFLLVIGGVFNSLEKSGLMKYMLDSIIHRYRDRRYSLMATITLFFMALGSLVGSFEECIPMVPIVVALAIGLGWDALVGMGMSLLAVGCGFAAGVCNPFTIGVAQRLAGLPLFSGIWLRLVSFALVYGLLLLFLRTYAKRIEKPIEKAEVEEFHRDAKLDRGLRLFAALLGIAILLVLSSSFLTFLQDYTMIIIAVMFLIAGIASVSVAGMSGKRIGTTFLNGTVSVLPAVAMILMATSVKYILQEAKILDTLLYYGAERYAEMPKVLVILFMYLIALVFNFFIASGSAKAFLLIPLFMPLAQIFGISPQLCIMAFAFGDGFSDVFYPTSPVLLISLGLTGVSYGKWARYCGVFMLLNLLLTCGILMLGFFAGY